MLTANNPEAPQNIARFHGKEKAFKLEAMVEQCAIHYSTDGWLLAKTSEEGKKQAEQDRLQEEALSKAEAEVTKRDSTSGDATDDSKQLRNQFNFSDRASQTTQQAPKDRCCYTEPPTTTTRSGSCSQWEIYDEYVRDIESQKLQEQLQKKRSTTARKTKNQSDAAKPVDENENQQPAKERGVSLRAAKVLERMTMQNVFDEMSMDLKYWDDDSDAFRPNEGSLLPLWKFHDAQSAGKQVTAICSNTRHGDVFAVGYGSYESLQQTVGLISIYSLKNPEVPEKNVVAESGILTVAFHPEFPNLLAAGCYDGSVKVMDAKGEVLYVSDGQRHREPVWQIFWKSEAATGALQLYSASTDGVLGLWTFTRAEIMFEQMMTITGKGATGNNAAGMLAVDFHQLEETTYLVATENGSIHRCSTDDDSEYLDTYLAHELPVYAVKWNRFHPDIFLSASEDWTVRLWDATTSARSLMKFELRGPVTDVAWAPYAATVFVAVTATVHRHAAVCEQRIVEKGRLTKILFHPQSPLLLVGDTSGVVHSLKLSPNLRKTVVGEASDAETVAKERQRLERVLAIARKSAA